MTKQKLESFVLLAKSSRGKSLKQLVQNVLSDSEVFVFAELLYSPNIQEMKQDPELSPYNKLLEIFTYGASKDYESYNNLPEMNPEQIQKLKLLSLVSLVSGNRNVLFSHLLNELSLGNVHELQHLLLEALQLGLIQGRIDMKNQILEVYSTMGRDPSPHQISKIIQKLEDWYQVSSDIQLKLNHSEDTLIQNWEMFQTEQKSFGENSKRRRKSSN